jgi:hypothetical protein
MTAGEALDMTADESVEKNPQRGAKVTTSPPGSTWAYARLLGDAS